MTPHEQMQAQRKRMDEILRSYYPQEEERNRFAEMLERYPKPTLLARLRAWLKGWRK